MNLRGSLATVLLVSSVTVGVNPATSVAGSTRASVGDTLRVGTMSLRPCHLGIDGGRTWCGSIEVPLDYTDTGAAHITIGFGWHSAADTTRGTIVAQEGGPGYPSTGSAADYATMIGPLLDDHDLLVVDARGTGRSTPLDCRPLQSLDPLAANARFERAVAACGDQLDHSFPNRRGGYVHASDLFTTANSARDLALVLRALDQGKVDLYGDSYGTYFAQSFLSRYPKLLRSVVLDSAYEARGLDPWYRSTVATARRAFSDVCTQSAACRGSVGSRSAAVWSRIGVLARRLRAHPVDVTAPGVDAHPTTVRLDVTALVNIVNDAGYDPDPYRQLDAAARAYLDRGDAIPLARLYAQDIGYDYSDYQARAAYYSDGLYLAVACSDYPQLFDMSSTPRARKAQLAQAIRHLPSATFAPFTTREWLRVLPYTETYTGCVSWPKPTHPFDPPVPTKASMDATGVPVLILNGALDSLTPAAGGAHIQRQIGAAARHIVVPGMVHLVGLYDRYGCGSSLVQQFLRQHSWHGLDTSCVAKVPEIHAVGSFPTTWAQAMPVAGNAAKSLRQKASIALAAAGDAAIRYNYVDGNRDLGLRGGRVSYRSGGADGAVTATLRAVHWTVDTSVSGSVRADGLGLAAVAEITVTSADGGSMTFRIRWDTRGRDARARIVTGTHRLNAPAP